jgi:hypothetical protein
MVRVSKRVAVLAVVIALTACNTMAQIQNVDNVAVSDWSNKRLGREEVRAAIVRAGAGLGWVMKDAGAGKIDGTPILRTHTAEVRIPYSATGYGIVYNLSTKLQASGGKIHSNYNGWIQNLNRGINAQLAAS